MKLGGELSVLRVFRAASLAVFLGASAAMLPSAPLQAQTTNPVPLNPQAEIAAALYAASATQAAALRVADEVIQGLRDEIERLGLDLSLAADEAAVERARLEAELAAKQADFVAQLEARDREYAQEIAVFRDAVEDIAQTPEGLEALALFNDGDELGAIAILDDLTAARAAAREAAAKIALAADKRGTAQLALEARTKGKLTTAAVIARYEEIVALDPGVFWDWVELRRLYFDAGDLPNAKRVAQQVLEISSDERQRSVALNELGDVQRAQGDLPAALASNEAGLEIRARLAERDPGNAEWQRDLSVSYDRIGDVQRAQGDLPAALASYEAGLEIRARLAERDPGNAEWQRDHSVSYNKIGDVQRAQGDLPAALASYEAGLEIAARLAERDPGNAEWQRDLIVSRFKLGMTFAASGDPEGAIQAFQEALRINAKLIALDPTNATWRRDWEVLRGQLERLGAAE